MHIKKYFVLQNYINKFFQIIDHIIYKSNDETKLIQIQKEKFKDIGFDYDNAFKYLQENFSIHECIDYNMFSQHIILFTAIKLKYPNIKKILEIGTYKGQATKFFADLFPDTEIVTFDLPYDDPIFLSEYNRDNEHELQKFKAEQDKLKLFKNIKHVKTNSIFLFEQININDKFDLIWVDGCHVTPIVQIDIVNAFQLLNNNGIMMCDDVFFDKSLYSEYADNGCEQILNEIKIRKNVTLVYIFKRFKNYYKNIKKIKHIAFLQKND